MGIYLAGKQSEYYASHRNERMIKFETQAEYTGSWVNINKKNRPEM